MRNAILENSAIEGLKTFQEAYITGIGKFLPNKPVHNHELENYLGTLNSRDSRVRDIVLSRNGIKQRHYALDPGTGRPTHTNAQLAAAAGKAALSEAGLGQEEVELLCCATTGPDQLIPNQAAMVQAEMELPTLEIAATSGACCAGVTALKYAWMAVRGGLRRNALVTASENASASLCANIFAKRFPNPDADLLERNPAHSFDGIFLRWMLSDGAGAFLIQGRPGRGEGLSFKIEFVDLWSYAHLYEPCMYCGAIKDEEGFLGYKGHLPPGDAEDLAECLILRQDAKLLDKYIIKTFGEALRDCAIKYELLNPQIDWFCPHVSSYYFMDKVLAEAAASGLDFSGKTFTNLETTGNTGSAAIFIMLEELAASGKLRPGQKILCFVPESARFSMSFFLLTVVGH
ncbi:MAG: hypothetical protein HY921_06790 [Elusimicrobia bacterium]|nr:hypothetical protein [Elusimicrobiota bacterium]